MDGFPQESHNNYLNKALKETHPSPANFTVCIVKELTMAETTLRKVKNGACRIIRKEYRKLNKRRTNLKAIYSTLGRVEYLKKIGKIVMKIQLTKGQMAVVEMKKKQKETEKEHVDDSDESDDESDDSSDSESENETCSNSNNMNRDSSDMNDSFSDETKSSVESNDPYEGRVIGKTNKNGKKDIEYEKPEYHKKRCLACNGIFNKKSKYQICKLCDNLIHVNNNKNCLKMKTFKKDENFVCKNCVENNTIDENGATEHTGEALNTTFIVPTLTNFECNHCSYKARNPDDLAVHGDCEHTNLCPICEENFIYGDAMREHVSVAHENQGSHQGEQQEDEEFMDWTFDGYPCNGLIVETLPEYVSFRPEKHSSVNSAKKVSVTFVGNVDDKIVNKIRKRKIGK